MRRRLLHRFLGSGIDEPRIGPLTDQRIERQCRRHLPPSGAALVAVKTQAQRLQFGAQLPIDIGGETRAARIIMFGGAVDRDRAHLFGILGDIGQAIGSREITDSRGKQRGEPGKAMIDTRPRPRAGRGVERAARLDQFGHRLFESITFC